jgi:prolyl oligopeptidase
MRLRVTLGPATKRARMRRLALALALLLVATPAVAADGPLSYPVAPRESDTETFFGTTVPDPYKSLENVDAAQTQSWVHAEGDLTRAYLDAIPQRAAIRGAFRGLMNYEKLGAPRRHGSRWFFFRNSGLQNQSVLYVRETLSAPPRVFLDPNRLAADGTIALAGTSFTHDGRLMAYATESSGSDWQTWHVRDVATGKDRSDVLRWSKFSDATWEGDRGFYYSAYDAPKAANATLSALGVQKLYYHALASPQRADRLIYASTAHPDEFVGADTTEDGRYVFLTTTKGNGNSLAWKRSGDPAAPFHPLFRLDPNVFYRVVDHDGWRLYLHTNAGAPRSRLVYVDLRDPTQALHEIVPQRRDKLESVAIVGDRFYLSYLHDAHAVTTIVDLHGRTVGALALPGIGSGGEPIGHREDRIVYYAFTSYTYPTTIYRYDTRTGASTIYQRPKIAFDPRPYATDLLFATSKDGTKVPVFVTHRKDMRYDGSTPTIAYGYGGFDIDETPGFRPSVALWLQMGGAYADVVLRGGGEYGDAWHDAGRLANKQHVFDDFIAAAQMLIARKITSTPKLAANGGSNGGLLVGAVLTQRPDLFGAAVPQVGVLDMLRFQRWTVGKAWVPEYGSADASARQFGWLYKYSPDDNVKDGTAYPPTLIMTSDHDDRVDPAHSFKFAALLQHAQAGDAPILLRVERKAGHGGGLPTEKAIDQVADVYAFLVKSLAFSPTLSARS